MQVEQYKLMVELVPEALWGRSIAATRSPLWDAIRRDCYRRAGYRCQLCGGVGPRWPVECHERWEYECSATNGIQHLAGVIALCPQCHAVKHLGRSQNTMPPAEFAELIKHWARVNEWPTDGRAEAYANAAIAEARDLWEWHNTLRWDQNLLWVNGAARRLDVAS